MSFLTLLQSQGTPSSQTITLNRVESTATVYAPTVARQASSVIALALVASTAQVFLPTVVQAGGDQTITLNRIESTAQVFLPTIQLVGAVTDTSDILDRYRRSRSESKEEENIAAQLLKARQKRPQIRKEYKEVLNWKKLIYAAIYGAETLEQLDGIKTSSIPNSSPEARAVLAEVEEAKAARRLELKLKMEEASLQASQLESQISAKVEEQRQAIEAIRQLQKEIVAKHQIAVKTAEEAYKQSLLEFQVAEEKAAEFTRKRNNRIKRIKALMWLAKLDI
jgi:hypothetical protein